MGRALKHSSIFQQAFLKCSCLEPHPTPTSCPLPSPVTQPPCSRLGLPSPHLLRAPLLSSTSSVLLGLKSLHFHEVFLSELQDQLAFTSSLRSLKSFPVPRSSHCLPCVALVFLSRLPLRSHTADLCPVRDMTQQQRQFMVPTQDPSPAS